MKKWYFYSPLILQKLIWVPTRSILSFFGHFEVTGLEHVESLKTHVIFACNHSSEIDPILIPAALPFWSRQSPMFYVSREKRFYGGSGWRRHFYGGKFFEAWGSYQVFVDLRDYEKALVNHLGIVRDGGSLCIFPEGRTTPNGIIQQAKGGVAYLAYTTKTPIIPVYIGGVFKLSFKDFLLRKKKITVRFGAPIYIQSAHGADIPVAEFRSYAAPIMDAIKAMI